MRTLAIRSVIFAALGCGVLAPQAHAAPILTAGYETQLETWLGLGPLDFTNIFTKSGPTDTTAMWHAAVDGQGSTISLLEATDSAGDMYVIGGYAPQSWDSFGNYHYTYTDLERTAFIFNLTTSALRPQRLTADPYCGGCGQYQTYNHIVFGPTFGGGHDLHVGYGSTGYEGLNGGYENAWGYGPGYVGLLPLNSYGGYYDYFTIGALETYTFASTSAQPVPEPTSLLLLGTGAAALLRRRRSSLRK